MHRRRETAHPSPTSTFLKPSPDMAMQFAPFGTHHQPTLSTHTEPISRKLPEVTSQAEVS